LAPEASTIDADREDSGRLAGFPQLFQCLRSIQFAFDIDCACERKDIHDPDAAQMHAGRQMSEGDAFSVASAAM
jgi:hypothetical protein